LHPAGGESLPEGRVGGFVVGQPPLERFRGSGGIEPAAAQAGPELPDAGTLGLASGFDVCRRIRERSDVPLLFLSARGEDDDKLRGLALGADDYIVKSATPAEVVARVKAVLRRSTNGRTTSRRRYGRMEVDLAAHEVLVDGRPGALTAREFELLTLFVTNPRQVRTREQIFERVWGSWGDRSAVSVYVRKLRDKLEVDARRPEVLVTVWGVGYRFDPPAAN
jgi:DNA-binding response OmpR family regulator